MHYASQTEIIIINKEENIEEKEYSTNDDD